jgi:hypothetical protein
LKGDGHPSDDYELRADGQGLLARGLRQAAAVAGEAALEQQQRRIFIYLMR